MIVDKYPWPVRNNKDNTKLTRDFSFKFIQNIQQGINVKIQLNDNTFPAQHFRSNNIILYKIGIFSL